MKMLTSLRLVVEIGPLDIVPLIRTVLKGVIRHISCSSRQFLVPSLTSP